MGRDLDLGECKVLNSTFTEDCVSGSQFSNRPVGASCTAGASPVRVRVLRVGPAHRGRRRGEQVPHGDGV